MSRAFDTDDLMIETKVFYPPLSDGVLIEEFMNEYMKNHSSSYTLININWTNLFVNQAFLNDGSVDVESALSNLDPQKKYFTVVQMDDGILHTLPDNCVKFGCCQYIPIPLVYQSDILREMPKKSFQEKSIFASFVGSLTHQVRHTMCNYTKDDYYFVTKQWSHNVKEDMLENFISVSINSKFCFAPRGYGRNSFRLWEVLELGSIPIYLWNDIDFLPFKDKIDYSKLCISLNIEDIDTLDAKLREITEDEYNNMLAYYETVRHYFTYKGIAEYILNHLENIK